MPKWLLDALDFILELLPEGFADKSRGYSLQVAAALVIFLAGRWLAGLLRKGIGKTLKRANVDSALSVFICNISYAAMMAFVIIAALSRLGVQTASFVALLGAAGLAVGLALQGSLSNFAAGVLLIMFRPIRANDLVEIAGTLGKVEAIDIFTTKLTTPDNKLVIIPNAKITDDKIINYTKKEVRRVDIVVGVSYDADLKKVKRVLMDVIKADARALADPEPMVVVLEFADSSINMGVRPWVKTEDYWVFLWDTLHAIKDHFDAEDITIPFPQRDVHLFKEQPGGTAGN